MTVKKTRMHYKKVDPIELDTCGEYFTRHMFAMTNENLHSKGAIAAQLGARDLKIDRLKAEVSRLSELLEKSNGLLSKM